VIAVNTSFRLAPWADALFAMDEPWWALHIKEVRDVFRGDLCSSSQHVKRHGVRSLGTMGRGWEPYGNSGAGAVSLAAFAGAARIMLLGYDCKNGPGGKVHWHGNHPRGLGNAGSMPKWPAQFAKLARAVAGVEVINCSRATALTVFPRSDLESELAR
jgi:hypothetical protein